MICCRCGKVKHCPHVKYAFDAEFNIDACKHFDEAAEYKYERIAKHDDLMRLLYDYFTGQVKGDYSDEEVKEALTRAMNNL